jgi:hypothetical protein
MDNAQESGQARRRYRIEAEGVVPAGIAPRVL